MTKEHTVIEISKILTDMQTHRISRAIAEQRIDAELEKLVDHYEYELAQLLWHLKLDDQLYQKYVMTLQAVENGQWGDACMNDATPCKECNIPLLKHDLAELRKCFVASVAKYRVNLD